MHIMVPIKYEYVLCMCGILLTGPQAFSEEKHVHVGMYIHAYICLHIMHLFIHVLCMHMYIYYCRRKDRIRCIRVYTRAYTRHMLQEKE